jgi:hypothetical protein
MFELHEGWTGLFTRQQAEGALPNKTRISKVRTEAADGHPIGTQGTVLGSISHPDVGMGYFVEWDPHPRTAVFVVSWKIAALSS